MFQELSWVIVWKIFQMRIHRLSPPRMSVSTATHRFDSVQTRVTRPNCSRHPPPLRGPFSHRLVCPLVDPIFPFCSKSLSFCVEFWHRSSLLNASTAPPARPPTRCPRPPPSHLKNEKRKKKGSRGEWGWRDPAWYFSDHNTRGVPCRSVFPYWVYENIVFWGGIFVGNSICHCCVSSVVLQVTWDERIRKLFIVRFQVHRGRSRWRSCWLWYHFYIFTLTDTFPSDLPQAKTFISNGWWRTWATAYSRKCLDGNSHRSVLTYVYSNSKLERICF